MQTQPVQSTVNLKMNKSNNLMGNRTRNLPACSIAPQKRSRSHVTTDGQSVSQSVCQGIEPTLGLVTRYYFLSEGCFLKVAVLSLWGALSGERSGLSLKTLYVIASLSF
jgi:hypothetical protein